MKSTLNMRTYMANVKTVLDLHGHATCYARILRDVNAAQAAEIRDAQARHLHERRSVQAIASEIATHCGATFQVLHEHVVFSTRANQAPQTKNQEPTPHATADLF